jgi:3-hydroxyacyl-CoA dehydrogenase
MSSSFNQITVLGAGVLGAQISFQIAYRGFKVITYDVSDAALKQARQRFDGIAAVYPTEVQGATEIAAAETIKRIGFTTRLASAVQGADLVIEAVPESLELKRDVFARIAALAPPAAVFVTNSSTLLPSELMDSTGRPDRFLALHFANHIWINNIAEVMGSPNTDPGVYQRVVAFANDIGMVPIELHKEQRGYVVNSLLGPLLMAAADLLLRGVADPNTIDTTWRIATGAPKGPFQILDIIGLRTVYAIASAGGQDRQAWADYLKRNYIDQGKLGVESGEGFYTYTAATDIEQPSSPMSITIGRAKQV